MKVSEVKIWDRKIKSREKSELMFSLLKQYHLSHTSFYTKRSIYLHTFVYKIMLMQLLQDITVTIVFYLLHGVLHWLSGSFP